MINLDVQSFYSKKTIDGVRYLFVRYGACWYAIERVFIPLDMRGRGLLSTSLKKVVQFADAHKLKLTASFLPDSDSEDDYRRLRTAFAKNGFIPNSSDGEVYRNDVTRLPNEHQR